jgi:hypothetical protein
MATLARLGLRNLQCRTLMLDTPFFMLTGQKADAE